MCNDFNSLIEKITDSILVAECRKRARNEAAYSSFVYALTIIIQDLWQSTHCYPVRECAINKRSGFYSRNNRYSDPLLTYKQSMAAFNGLVAIGLIKVTRKGYYDAEKFKGSLTRFEATDKLVDLLKNLQSHPALYIKPNINSETIILKSKSNGRKTLIDYKDTKQTIKYRANLKMINECLLRHWPDLEITDQEYKKLSMLIKSNKKYNPIDFSKRTLVRIFSNGSFSKGGRFYRGWWQNIPSMYRKNITIDMKKTCEYDFSQLNPHMLYCLQSKELGSEDAYDRVLDGKYRNLVKSSFNAMIQADKFLQKCPDGIDLSNYDITWAFLRERILKSHKPIQDLFFRGIGNNMQYEDSCICEGVMLGFAKIDAPSLPVHDSFVMHHGYAGELEEAMRREFHRRFKKNIPIKGDVIEPKKADDSPPVHPDFDDIFKGDEKYSLWETRNDMWNLR